MGGNGSPSLRAGNGPYTCSWITHSSLHKEERMNQYCTPSQQLYACAGTCGLCNKSIEEYRRSSIIPNGFECLFDEEEVSCPYCLSCLGQCDDECGFYSYPSREDLLSCIRNLLPTCRDTCKDVCNEQFAKTVFGSDLR